MEAHEYTNLPISLPADSDHIGRLWSVNKLKRVREKQAAGLLLISMGSILWGTVGVASEWLYKIDDITPFGIGFFRLALSALPLGIFCLASRGRKAFYFQKIHLPIVILLGLAMALYQVAFFTAVTLVGVTLSTLVAICVGPPLIVLFSRVLWDEPITHRIAIALVTSLVGATLVIGFPNETAETQSTSFVLGIIWALGAALSYAIFVMSSRTLAMDHEAFELVAVGFGIGALILLPLAVAQGHLIPTSIPSAAGILFIGLVPTALAYSLYFKGMRQVKASAASIVSLMEPLTAAILAWILFGETLGPLGLTGGLILLGSVYILTMNAKIDGQ